MLETLQDLRTRRSCRKYTDEQIKNNELQSVLEAGTFAPTGRGRQAAVIVVVQDKDLLKKLSVINAKIKGVDADQFYGAPTLLIVLADKKIPTYFQDGVLVLGNLLNAAHAIGLGSCYVNRARETFATEFGKNLLIKWGLNNDYVGIGNCVLGYPADGGIGKAAPRKKNYVIYAK
jgi:nitroreductase